ncbi:MAG TPA: Rrf2 family transcriptional regulator [Candidatus Acidoferrum sp.]|nr:Rrf2 family transcriptional regulator [Candidatus Acidoferrum sp.]
MQITRATDYAVRVVVQLATLPKGKKAQLAALGVATGVSGSFLSKVLQRLVHAGLVTSHRGTGGGFCLRPHGEKITLLQVIEAMEGPTKLNQCLIAGLSCDRKPWCGVHPIWQKAQEALTHVLASVTVAEMAKGTMANLAKQADHNGAHEAVVRLAKG